MTGLVDAVSGMLRAALGQLDRTTDWVGLDVHARWSVTRIGALIGGDDDGVSVRTCGLMPRAAPAVA